MRFDSFLDRLEDFKRAEVSANDAHDAILPIMAKERKLAFERDPDPKMSAVAATVFPKDDHAHLVLIERQSYQGVHSAQVGFPGGKAEEDDADLEATALREMEEELGIDRGAPNFVRRLSHVYIPPSRFLVQPYVYYLEEMPNYVPDDREVQSVIEMPLEHLLDDQNVVQGKIKMSNGMVITTPYFAFQDYKIWGATAMMLSEMKRILEQIK